MRLVYNWGINDADYVTRRCQIYKRWASMIRRCHSPRFQAKHSTYVGCHVDEPWKYFMAFRAWYLEQSPRPKDHLDKDHLDKDFLGDGKLYSPETCCFIPQWFNSLFIAHSAERGYWPQGVSYDKQHGKFQAQIRCKGKQFYLGRFNTPEEASASYLEAKEAYVEELLLEFPYLSPRIVAAIRRKMAELIQQENHYDTSTGIKKSMGSHTGRRGNSY